MSDLIVIGFDDEHTAFEMRAALAKLQKEYLIDMEDVVVVTKDDKGKVKLHQAVNLTAAGAMGGLFAATVRASPTGIVLVAELSGSFGLLSAMVLTCRTASITAQSLRSKPIYNLLLARTLGHTVGSGPPDDERLGEAIR